MDKIISDYESPIVKGIINKITNDNMNTKEKLEVIFYYVRDNIKFGFLPKIDNYTASEIIEIGIGQCNNKSGVFLALCKAANIESRIHFSGITKNIQRGLFKGIAYRFMPVEISHSWVEVKIDNKWISIDSFINDIGFYEAGKRELNERNWSTGFSVSCESGESSAELDMSGERFVQMDAVTEDFKNYEDPSFFYSTSMYNNNPNLIKRLVYLLSLPGINRRVKKIRKKC